MPACCFPARRLLPSVAPFRPGFQSCASPPAFRSLSRWSSEHHSYLPPERPAPLVRAGFFCRCPLMSRAAYLPFPLLPLRGTVRAFDPRSRLGLSVAPPFGLGVPHEPCRRQDLLCPLLTSATQSGESLHP